MTEKEYLSFYPKVFYVCGRWHVSEPLVYLSTDIKMFGLLTSLSGATLRMSPEAYTHVHVSLVSVNNNFIIICIISIT